MSDIVTLARRHKHVAPTHYEGCEVDHIGCLVNRLADEIEGLRAEIERLRDTNKQLVSGIYTIACIKDEEIELLREENKRLRAEHRAEIERLTKILEGKP